MPKHEILLILAGVLLLISLPFFDGFGFKIWLAAKFFYLLGVVIMFARKETRVRKS